jgi:hypothetical protein
MSPCRYGNDINKTIHFEKNWKNVSKNYNVFVPSTSPDCAVSNLIPEKSKRQYDKCYNDFKERCNKNNVKTVSENVVLAYLMEKSNCEKFNFMEYIFNVEAHDEHTGWHWCYEVSETGTFFEKKSVGYQVKKCKVLTRDQINLLYNLPFF